MKKVLKSHTKFKPSIFKEGLRQVKIPGIVYTVICALVSIICTLSEFPFKYDSTQHDAVAPLIPSAVEDTVVWLVLCSAIFIFGASVLLFNFLRSHKARDFYCSTPNSICTIWLSFVTSIMTWATIGIAAANIIQLPFMMIADVKYFPTWLLTLIGLLAIDILACGIMSLACALTGRLISMLVTTAAILLLPVSVYLAATTSFEVFFSEYDFIFTDRSVYYGYVLDFITSSTLIFGCLLLGVIYLALAAWFMTIRTGDAAGKPFVNKAAQVISLTVVSIFTTTIVINCLAYEIVDAMYDEYRFEDYVNVIEYIIYAVISILAIIFCFWAANVILTFDIKKSHRMLRFLPIPVVFCVAVFGAGFGVSYADFHTNPTADEIKSFTLVRNEHLNDDLAIYRMNYTYGRAVTQNYEFTDEKVIEYLASQIDEFIKAYDNDFLAAYDVYDGVEWNQYNEINFRINLKNGRSITRAIPVTDEFIDDLAAAIKNDSEFNEKFFALPDAEHVNINVSNGYDGTAEHYYETTYYETDEIISDEDTVKLYECFAKEFASLPAEKRREYLKASIYDSYNTDELYLYADDLYYDEESDMFYDEETDMSYDEEYGYYYPGYGYIQYEDGVVSSSDMESVSDSDIDFVISDLTEKQGEYHASMQSCVSTSSLDKLEFMKLSIRGYNSGRIYDSEYYFNQEFILFPALFPETCSLLTEICNKNMDSFLEIPEKLNDYSSLNINAYYYNGETVLNMQYDYIDEGTYHNILEYYENVYGEPYFNEPYFHEPYYFYYDNGTLHGELRPNGVDEISISGEEYVQKLFDDAAKTDDVDLSKPYCKLYVSFESESGEYEYYSIYVQTESLVDLVVPVEDDTAEDYLTDDNTAEYYLVYDDTAEGDTDEDDIGGICSH